MDPVSASLAQPTNKAKRCPMTGCNKKLSLCDFACKCANIYCSLHRASESHSCAFDYKAEARDKLLKVMSTSVTGKKLEMI